jgi:hypothetical protein
VPRLATRDAAGRSASVEHPLEVGLFPAGDLHVSDVFVGHVVDGHFRPVGGHAKATAQAVLPLAHVGPGLHHVVATVLQAGKPIGTVSREVVVGEGGQ